jgi:hypothetical protein
MQWAEIKDQAGHVCENTPGRVHRIKLPRFDESWTLFHHQFKAVAEHNWIDWGRKPHTYWHPAGAGCRYPA